jgi:hypothetical protein
MSMHLEKQFEDDDVRAADSRFFYMVKGGRPTMYDLSTEFRDNYYHDLMPHHSASLVTPSQESEEPLITDVTTGASQQYPDAWRWSVQITAGEQRDILACDVSWGGGNWQKTRGHMQGRLWRDSTEIQADERGQIQAAPGSIYDGQHAIWQHLRPDNQGRLWRQAFIDDSESILNKLINNCLSDSNIKSVAEKLRSDKAHTKAEYEANPPPYYTDLNKFQRHWRAIGFVSLGQARVEFAAATYYVDQKKKIERAVPIEDLPTNLLQAIAEPPTGLKALYITNNSSGRDKEQRKSQ